MIRKLTLSTALLLAAAPALPAGPVTVYQCTEPDGSITLQTDEPCPEGRQQEIRVVNVPPPVTLRPPYVEPRVLRPSQLPVLRAGVEQTERADGQAVVAEPEPPPPLFQCTRWDNTRYLHENDEPEPQCRPLQTVGIGGVPGVGAGRACERVHDACEPVPDDALCQAWETRLRETEFHWKFADSRRDAESLRAEYERLARIHGASTCAMTDG